MPDCFASFSLTSASYRFKRRNRCPFMLLVFSLTCQDAESP